MTSTVDRRASLLLTRLTDDLLLLVHAFVGANRHNVAFVCRRLWAVTRRRAAQGGFASAYPRVERYEGRLRGLHWEGRTPGTPRLVTHLRNGDLNRLEHLSVFELDSLDLWNAAEPSLPLPAGLESLHVAYIADDDAYDSGFWTHNVGAAIARGLSPPFATRLQNLRLGTLDFSPALCVAVGGLRYLEVLQLKLAWRGGDHHHHHRHAYGLGGGGCGGDEDVRSRYLCEAMLQRLASSLRVLELSTVGDVTCAQWLAELQAVCALPNLVRLKHSPHGRIDDVPHEHMPSAECIADELCRVLLGPAGTLRALVVKYDRVLGPYSTERIAPYLLRQSATPFPLE